MKYLATLFMFLFAVTARAEYFGSLGVAMADTNLVEDDLMLAVEGGWQNEWLRIGVHLMGDADVTHVGPPVLVTPPTPPATPRNPDPVARDPYYVSETYDYSTYGACVGVHRDIGGIEPYVGACFNHHNYGFRDEDAAGARAGVAINALGMRIGFDYFYDDTDVSQERFMLSGSYGF